MEEAVCLWLQGQQRSASLLRVRQVLDGGQMVASDSINGLNYTLHLFLGSRIEETKLIQASTEDNLIDGFMDLDCKRL